jgi:TatD DNase family protein
MEKYKYIDCHSHPQDIWYKKDNVNSDEILENLASDGGATIAIGTDYENSLQAINLAKKHENVWATIGIHPADNHAEVYSEEKFQELLNLGGEKVVGIGECGLDYFYFKSDFEKKRKADPEFKLAYDEYVEQHKARQRGVFISQIEFAAKNNLPLVLHGRPSKNSMDAYRDMLDILENPPAWQGDESPCQAGGLRGHAHFFVGNLEIAKRFLDLGFLMSYDGPITFTKEYDEVIKFLPIEKIMIETDSPYAAPSPHRGEINYPIYVKHVAEKIAELKNLSLAEVLEITKNNTIKLFELK